MRSATKTPTQPKKILCIEDEHFISALYARALTKAGYNVTVVIDGQEGLDEAKTNRYDLILLDLMVPTITGSEILRQLRDSVETPNLKAKIVITTNLEQDEETRAAVEKMADGYIIKAEITPRQLVEFLGQLQF